MRVHRGHELVQTVESEKAWAQPLTDSTTLRKFLNTSGLGASVHVTGQLVAEEKVRWEGRLRARFRPVFQVSGRTPHHVPSLSGPQFHLGTPWVCRKQGEPGTWEPASLPGTGQWRAPQGECREPGVSYLCHRQLSKRIRRQQPPTLQRGEEVSNKAMCNCYWWHLKMGREPFWPLTHGGVKAQETEWQKNAKPDPARKKLLSSVIPCKMRHPRWDQSLFRAFWESPVSKMLSRSSEWMGEGRMERKITEISYSPLRRSRGLIQGRFNLRQREGTISQEAQTSEWGLWGGTGSRGEAGASEKLFRREEHNWRHRSRTALNVQYQHIVIKGAQSPASTDGAGPGEGSRRIKAERSGSQWGPGLSQGAQGLTCHGHQNQQPVPSHTVFSINRHFSIMGKPPTPSLKPTYVPLLANLQETRWLLGSRQLLLGQI